MSVGGWLISKLFGLGGLIKSGAEWLFEKPIRVLVACLILLILIQHFTLGRVLREREEALQRAADTQRAFDQTVENYRVAALAAKRFQDAKIARVEREQAMITERTVHDYEARLAVARDRAERLRSQAATAGDRSGAGGAVLPVAGAPAGGTHSPSEDIGLPAPGAVGTELTLEERLIATEQAIQLDALIDWVEQQAGIDFNAPALAPSTSEPR